MKKIIMLLMVSVFFLMGGEYESMAQRGEYLQNVSNNQIGTVVRPGQTVLMNFYIGQYTDWIEAYLYVQRPGSALKYIITLGRDGRTYNPNPEFGGRFSISFDASRNVIQVSISSAQVWDMGDYYIALRRSFGEIVFLLGQSIVVTNE